jgi:flagellar biosynthesis/type III secretory pathway chaperone
MSDNWETEIAGLLAELADVQSALLAVLTEKRQLLASADHAALSTVAGREQQLVARLEACHRRRQELLGRAQVEGLPSDSIRSLSAALPTEGRDRLQASIDDAAKQSQFLQNQSLTNWVLVQRSLLHLSQLIEIIATGGRPQPTYGNGSECQNRGALVDRAA